MGFVDKAKAAAKKAANQHGDKVSDATSKAGKFVNEQTGGKHADKIEKAQKKVNDTIDENRDGRSGGSADGRGDDNR